MRKAIVTPRNRQWTLGKNSRSGEDPTPSKHLEKPAGAIGPDTGRPESSPNTSCEKWRRTPPRILTFRAGFRRWTWREEALIWSHSITVAWERLPETGASCSSRRGSGAALEEGATRQAVTVAVGSAVERENGEEPVEGRGGGIL